MAPIDLRIADLMTFLAVQRTRSITGAARELRVTPSQVSKSISRVERHCDAKLFVRGTKGVSLNDAGVHVAAHVAAAVASIEATRRPAPTTSTGDKKIELTVAGPSYLLEALLPAVAHSHPRLRVRALELSPPLIRAYITENSFDVALVPSDITSRPSTWTSDQVGLLHKSLFASPALAKRLSPLPTTVEKIRDVPWVAPAASGNRLAPITDDCPIPIGERVIAHEAQTIRTALDLAATGEYLVFGPFVAAKKLVQSGAMIPITVKGWDISEPLFLLCNGEAVLAKVREGVVRAVRDALAGV
jgi:DNA-binding transcriptional LysR family regulator